MVYKNVKGGRILDNKIIGYDELESFIIFTRDIKATLSIRKSDLLNIDIKGPRASELIKSGGDTLIKNSIVKLSNSLNTSPNVTISLNKHIPICSGLGGGSANSAATLRGLLKLWKINLNYKTLASLALDIGSDVPVCIFSKQSLVRGKGDKIIPFKILTFDTWVVIVKPLLGAKTKIIFKDFKGPILKRSYPSKNFNTFLKRMNIRKNSLQKTTEILIPEIKKIILLFSKTPGRIPAQMTGSGSAVFKIFKSKKEAEKAHFFMQKYNHKWWIKISRLKI